jgi:hypothetical protein
MTWLLLILALPTGNATARMRAWRALKSCGAVMLRDGVYLLPNATDRNEALTAIAQDVERSGGMAYLLKVAGVVDYPFQELFDRSGEYERLAAEIAACQDGLAGAGSQDVAKQLRKVRKAFDALSTVDFFPGEARRQVESLLAALDRRCKSGLGADEPSAHSGGIRYRDVAGYRGRQWATRKRPWVDRLASAWLIRRFIDPDAGFMWLDSPADCPAGVLGFDFDGAEFTHVGERVTFETLRASFGLEDNPALQHIGRIVHFLDVGGLPAPDAPGLERLLRGMKSRIEDDDALILETGRLFDDLYLTYEETPESP